MIFSLLYQCIVSHFFILLDSYCVDFGVWFCGFFVCVGFLVFQHLKCICVYIHLKR